LNFAGGQPDNAYGSDRYAVIGYGGNTGWDNYPDAAFRTPSAIVEIAPVPIPAAVWLLGSGLIGLAALRRKMRK
jgi:hypothetical protein